MGMYYKRAYLQIAYLETKIKNTGTVPSFEDISEGFNLERL
jgi:hypothetical protein